MGRLIAHSQQQAEEHNKTIKKLKEHKYKQAQKGKEYVIRIDERTCICKYFKKKPTAEQIEQAIKKYIKKYETP